MNLSMKWLKEFVDIDVSPKEFAEKILSYIWDDVAKIDIEEWFGNIKSYDELLSSYEKNSVKVFNKLFDNYQIHIEENNDEQSNESDTI